MTSTQIIMRYSNKSFKYNFLAKLECSKNFFFKNNIHTYLFYINKIHFFNTYKFFSKELFILITSVKKKLFNYTLFIFIVFCIIIYKLFIIIHILI